MKKKKIAMTVVWSKVESKINSLLKGLPLDRSSDPKSHARIDHSSDHRKSNSSQECMIPQIMKWPCGVTPVLEPSSFTPVLEPCGVTPVFGALWCHSRFGAF